MKRLKTKDNALKSCVMAQDNETHYDYERDRAAQ